MTAEIWALVLALPLGQFSTLALATVVPALRQDLRMTYAELGLVLAAFGIARVLVDLPAGEIARRFSPRLVLLISLSASLSASVMGLLANEAWQVGAARALNGAASAISQAVALAWLVGASRPNLRGRVMALHEACFSLFFLAVPSVAGILASVSPLGWRAAFAMGCAAGALAVLVVVIWTREESGRQALGHVAVDSVEPAITGTGWSSLRPGGSLLLAAYLATVAVFYGRHATINTLIPVVGAEEVGLSTSALGFALSGMALVSLIAIMLGGWLGDRYGRSRVLIPGVVLLAVCHGALLLITDAPSFILVTALQGLGYALNSLPTGLMGDALPPAARARGIALYRLVADISLLVAPTVVGFALELGGFTGGKVVVLVPTLLILVLLIGLLGLRPRGRGSHVPE